MEVRAEVEVSRKEEGIWYQMIPCQWYQNLISMRNVCKKKKIATSLTNKKYVLVSSYFCIYISCLLDFNTDNIISFDIKYFFPRKSFTHIHLD